MQEGSFFAHIFPLLSSDIRVLIVNKYFCKLSHHNLYVTTINNNTERLINFYWNVYFKMICQLRFILFYDKSQFFRCILLQKEMVKEKVVCSCTLHNFCLIHFLQKLTFVDIISYDNHATTFSTSCPTKTCSNIST